MSLLDELYFYKALGYKFTPNLTPNSPIVATNLTNLNKEITNCNLCELCKTRNKSVVGSGDNQAKIMIVSSSPGRDEDKTGVAKIDEKLREILGELGGVGIYFTYALKCAQNKNILQRNFWYNQCSDYLSAEISFVAPNLIVALGERAFGAVSGELDFVFESVRGGVFRYKNWSVLPTYSLEFLAKNPSKFDEFRSDLCQIKGYL